MNEFLTNGLIELANKDVAGLRTSKSVVVYKVTESKIDCDASGCEYDPILEESILPYCPDCSGTGWVITESLKKYTPSVLSYDIKYDYSEGGAGPAKGDLRFDFDVDDYNDTPSHFEYGGLFRYLNKDYRITGIDFRGLGPEPNRLIVTVQEVS
jgi:hypothetical protein